MNNVRVTIDEDEYAELKQYKQNSIDNRITVMSYNNIGSWGIGSLSYKHPIFLTADEGIKKALDTGIESMKMEVERLQKEMASLYNENRMYKDLISNIKSKWYYELFGGK